MNILGFSRDIAPALIDVIYCCLFYVMLVAGNFKYGSNPTRYYVSSIRQYIFLILSAFFVITAFSSGDFYHYKGLVEYSHVLDEESVNHMEEIYSLIISCFNRDYFVFRVIVFGIPVLLFARTMKLFTGDFYYPLFFLLATLSSNFSYSRSSIAFACYFFGLYHILCLYANRGYKIFHLLEGIVFIALSVNFHRSSILLIAVLPFLFVRLRKNTIIIICILLPAIMIVLREAVDALLLGDISAEEVVSERISSLSTFSRHGSTFQQTVRRFFNFGSILIPFIFITKHYARNYKLIPDIFRGLYQITLGIILVSISTLSLGFDNIVLFYRILYMAIIPVICLLFEFRKIGIISPVLYKRLLLFGITNEILERLYGLYFTYNGFVS